MINGMKHSSFMFLSLCVLCIDDESQFNDEQHQVPKPILISDECCGLNFFSYNLTRKGHLVGTFINPFLTHPLRFLLNYSIIELWSIEFCISLGIIRHYSMLILLLFYTTLPLEGNLI